MGVNETVRGLIYDSIYKSAYIAVEVNGNQYLNSKPIELWASSAYTNQTNIAIVVYEKYCKRSHINFFSWSAKVC